MHDREVTFSLVVSEAILGSSQVMESYRVLAGGIVAGLKMLGADARLVDRGSRRKAARAASAAESPIGRGINPACFAAKASCDLVVGGNKVVGSAQMRKEGVILQQNSLPLQLDLERWSQAFPSQGNSDAVQAIGLETALGMSLSFQQVAEAIGQGMGRKLGVKIEIGQSIPEEEGMAEQLRPACSICKSS